MKKVVAMMLSLVLALGLMAGCGQKDAGKASGGTKTIESLKIAFSPYADADQITTATEPLEALLKAKLLEKGYDVQNIDMTVGTSYTAVGEALSAGSADIGFISGGNYVLFSDDCDVLLTALRYGINKDSDNPADWNDGTIEENTQDMTTYYRSIILAGPSAKGQELLKKVNAGEELTWDDLNSATWSVLAPTSASGYIYPSLWLQEHYGKTIADLDHVVQSDSHSTSLARLATGQADVMVSYGHIRIKNAPIWQEKLGGTAPMVEQTGIIGVTEGIYNDMIAYSKTSDLMADEDFRKALGEAFDMKPGELTTGKIYAALRRLGFNKVFDTNFSADVTIMEEGTEFVKRFTKGGKLPLITSCCPAWTAWMEKYAPDFTENFSSAKSPQQMLSALAKSYWADKNKVDFKKVHVTSIMPCTAKKYEIGRDEYMSSTGTQDTDVVLTTRELARMIKAAGIDFANLPEENADDLLGAYTGAGTIFGVTGGVMEAALRTAYCLITGEAKPPAIEFQAVRGMDGVKTATIDIKGTKVNIAVAHQMGNVEKVLDEVREDLKAGKKPRYDFIEVMACRGGCIGGGGQPCLATDEVRALRTKGLYTDDEKATFRMSHLNPEVQALYKDFLGEPGSGTAERILHTHYHKRECYEFNK